jgi:uridine kinase
MAPTQALVVGVAGASGSGKTRVAQELARRLEAGGKSAVVVSVDWFYQAPVPGVVSVYGSRLGPEWMQQTIERVKKRGTRRSSGVPTDLCRLPAAELIAALETQLSVDAGTYNWDTPAALDLDGLCTTIETLRDGEGACVPEFNFASRQRDKRRTLQPAKVVIVEGLFAFATAALQAAAACKIFIDASKATTWARKLARDSQAGRGGHGESYLRTQFEQAWAMNLLHVAPAKELGGVRVVCNDEDGAWESLVEEVVGHVTRACQARACEVVGDEPPPAKRAKK